MPLPLIIGIGAAVASAIGGGAMLLDASARIQNAKEQYGRRRKKYEGAEQLYDSRRQEVDARFNAFGKRRLEALTTLGRAVDFLKKAKIRDRDLEQQLKITPQQLARWESASVQASEVLGGLTSSGVAGVSTAAGVYGLVSTLGTASTGTAIGTLSGAAAKSATLAWLGGGPVVMGGGGVVAGTMVLGGLIAGPAVLAAGFFANSKAEKVETEVAEEIAKMDVAEAQIGQQLSVIEIVLDRVDEVHEATDEVDKALQDLLDRGNPTDLKDVYKVVHTATSLGELLDVAFVDKNGNITLN